MADQVSENDVESLGEKLDHFSQTLTPGEQAALTEILERATTEEGDVQGFSHRPPAAKKQPSSVKMLVKSIIPYRPR
ncbi:MAG: hypothetical protein ACYDER_01750 [Ktedonobacteraceae bacterium]